MDTIQAYQAYIAANKYFTKESLPFGVGVIGSTDEEIAKADSVRRKNVMSFNQWYCISIPDRKFFLELTKPVIDQSSFAREALFSQSALSMLFYSECQSFMKMLDSYVQEKAPEEKLDYAKKELESFFNTKRAELLNFTSAENLIHFIISRAIQPESAIASSFLAKFGIPGVFYKDFNGERILIFDAKHDITVLDVSRELLANTVLIS